jgi:hypothetical protein
MNALTRSIVPLALAASAWVPALGAQLPSPAGSATRATRGIPGVTISGSTEITSEAYGASGIADRRPSGSWRIGMRPTITLFGELSASLDLLLTNEVNQFRQNVNQVGVHPKWRWATFHLGDFSQPLTPYTVQGVRVRGAGMDLRPGAFRFSVQGGRTQRPVFAGSQGTVFQRNLVAAKLGLGRESGTFLDLNLVKARDDITRRELQLLIVDSTFIDTLPGGAFRPQIGTRPQENLVAGLQGQLQLFKRRVSVKGEVAAALVTNDLTAPLIDSALTGPAAALGDFQDVRLSTSGDFAYTVEATANLSRLRMRTGYEYVGPGYSSLGLAYLIGDRRSLNWDGSWQLPGDRVVLQGQFRRMGDNLLGQRIYTTERDTYGGGLMLRITQSLTGSVNAMRNVVLNDAAVDTFAVDVQALALTSSLSSQQQILGRRTVVSIAHAFQNSLDGNTVSTVPDVKAQNLSVSLQLFLTDRFSVTPSFAAVTSEVTGQPRNQNVQIGFRAAGTLLENALRLSAAITNARTTQGRDVNTANANVSWNLPGEVRMNLAMRASRYAAFGAQTAFQEQVATLSFGRNW